MRKSRWLFLDTREVMGGRWMDIFLCGKGGLFICGPLPGGKDSRGPGEACIAGVEGRAYGERARIEK